MGGALKWRTLTQTSWAPAAMGDFSEQASGPALGAAALLALQVLWSQFIRKAAADDSSIKERMNSALEDHKGRLQTLERDVAQLPEWARGQGRT